MKKRITTPMLLLFVLIAAMIIVPQIKAQSRSGSIILNPTDDASIWMEYPDNNYGAGNYVNTRNRYGHSSHPYHWEVNSLIKFDLSSIPPGASIVSAKLYLYYFYCSFNNCTGRNLSCWRITSDWNEGTVTWNTQPSCSSLVTSYSVVPAAFGWMDWDVTSDVQAFINAEKTNYGWEMKDTTYWGNYNVPDTRFHSKEYGDYIPYLEIHIEQAPSITQWGLIALLIIMAGIATWVVLRRRRVVTA